MDATSLLAITEGNRALLRELARLCLHEDAPRLRAELHRAARVGDAPALEFSAHALKSLVAQFHAEAARAVAEEIESAARAGEIKGLGAQIEVFEREYEDLAALLQAILDEPA